MARRREALARADDGSSKWLIRATVRTVGAQTNEARLGGEVPKARREVYFTMYSDEREMRDSPEEVRGPYPLEYFLASIGFCELTMYGRWAAYLGLDVDEVSLSINGVFDMRGLYGIADYDPAFSEIDIDIDVKGRVARDQVKELIKWVRRCCPMFNTIKKAVKLNERVYHDGELIDQIELKP